MTIVPHLEPSTRNVLVAPELPLPYSLMSMSKKYLLIQIAVGIEPIRYANNMSSTSVIFAIGLKLDGKINQNLSIFVCFVWRLPTFFCVFRSKASCLSGTSWLYLN